MRSVVRWFGVVAACALIAAAGSAPAKTPDGRTPAEEQICEPLKDLKGPAFGLCNAYCEAQDCDVHDRKSCPQLLKNFEKKTGLTEFPCDCTEEQEYDPALGCVCSEDVVRECDADGGVLDPETCSCECPEPQIFDPQLGCTCDTGKIAECAAVGGELNERCECVVPLCGDSAPTPSACEEGVCPRGQSCLFLQTECGCMPDFQEPPVSVCGLDPQTQQCGGECPDGQSCFDIGTAAPVCRCRDDIQ